MKNKINRLCDAFINTCESGKFMAVWVIVGIILLIGVQFAAIGVAGDQDPKEVFWAIPAMCVWLATLPAAVIRKYLC
jgi:hypothetical protein